MRPSSATSAALFGRRADQRAGPGQRFLVRLVGAGGFRAGERGLEGFVPLDLLLPQRTDPHDLAGDPRIGGPFGRLRSQSIDELLGFVEFAFVDFLRERRRRRRDAARLGLVQDEQRRGLQAPVVSRMPAAQRSRRRRAAVRLRAAR